MKATLFIFLLALLGTSLVEGQDAKNLQFSSDLEEEAFTEWRALGAAEPLKLLLAIDTSINKEDYEQMRYYLDSSYERYYDKALNPGLVRKVFNQVRRDYLNTYVSYPLLSNTLEKQEFNCVSGVALSAYVFHKIGIPFNIKEISHHVYLTVEVKKSTLLLEVTDPGFGFARIYEDDLAYYSYDTTDRSPVFQILKAYSDQKDWNFHINESISIPELAGIQYYNLGLQHVLGLDFQKAAHQFEKAYTLYPSDRILTMLKLSLLECLKDRNLNKDQKAPVLEKYRRYHEINNWMIATATQR